MTSHPAMLAAWRFDAIGTRWSVESFADLDAVVRARIADRVETFDRDWSRFRDDSLVSRIGRETGEFTLPAEATVLQPLYRMLYETTRGRISPLVGRRLETLGYDAGYRLLPQPELADVPAWDDAISWVGRELRTARSVVLDIGAAGKGLLVDTVGRMLDQAGVDEYVVDASGDILLRRNGPERIALEHPADPSRAIGVAQLSRGALCASASNRRAWQCGGHHILDALTGRPVREIVASWVVAEETMVADGLTTALFVADPAALRERFDFEWVRMHADGRIDASADFPGEVFA